MWTPVFLYRHKDNRDLAFQIVKAFYVKSKSLWKLKVMWWNIGSHKPWCMNHTQRIDIPLARQKEWVAMAMNETLPPPEHVEWKPPGVA
jgi:hypothetical protein